MTSRLIISLATASLLAMGGSAAANNYWQTQYSNQGDHFSQYDYVPSPLQSWNIDQDDRYLIGNFVNHFEDMAIAIKPRDKYVLMHFLSQYNKWWSLKSGSRHFDFNWVTQSNDLFAVGDFDGDGADELFAANPNSSYKTLKLGNGPNYTWQVLNSSSMSFASNFAVLAGDFDGDGRDEVFISNPGNYHQTMRFDVLTQQWQFINRHLRPQIGLWYTAADDKYLVGDFDGDGKDEILAINANGYHHTIKLVNNKWQFQEGNGNGLIASWIIGQPDQFVAGDFNSDGKTDVLAINAQNGWSHVMTMNNNQWQYLSGNNGDGYLGDWQFTSSNVLLAQHSYNRHRLFMFDPSGWWKVIRY